MLISAAELLVSPASSCNELNQFRSHVSALPLACHGFCDLQVQQVLKVNYIPNYFTNLFPDMVNWDKV